MGRRLAVTVVVAALAVLLLGEQPSAARSREEPEGVSLLQLIATPRAYHEKVVRVIGFAFLEFEGHGLYLHKEDFEHSLLKNSVWLDTPYPIPDASHRLT